MASVFGLAAHLTICLFVQTGDPVKVPPALEAFRESRMSIRSGEIDWRVTPADPSAGTFRSSRAMLAMATGFSKSAATSRGGCAGRFMGIRTPSFRT